MDMVRIAAAIFKIININGTIIAAMAVLSFGVTGRIIHLGMRKCKKRLSPFKKQFKPETFYAMPSKNPENICGKVFQGADRGAIPV
jgi:hypothetical protein